MVDNKGVGIPGTESQKQQNTRFKNVVETWSEQLDKGEVISFSDTNINLHKNFNNINEISESDKKLLQIFRMLQDKIFNKGASVLQTKPTKIYENKNNTFIDHIISNHPTKILSHKVLDEIFSDHLIVKVIISNKTICHYPRYRMIRDYTRVNWYNFNWELSEEKNIQLATTCTDANMICELLIRGIRNKMDKHCPEKRIQVNNKIPNFLSKETREIMKKRDEAMTTSKTTGKIEDVREFRTLRNRAHKMIKTDKEIDMKKTFEKTEGRTKEQWKTTKNAAGWNKKSISHNSQC